MEDRRDRPPRARGPALRPASWLVSGGRPGDPGSALNTPLVPASNFRLGAGRAYAREEGTETIASFERLLGGLEGGEATAFATGMAAAAAVFELLETGALVVLPEDVYQGVASLAADGAARGRWSVQRLPTTHCEAWQRAAGEADLLWLETPSNPLLEVADLPAIAAAPRRPGCRLAVDNTFATPLAQRPLALGADLVVHSATKFLGGHSDLLLGAVVTADPTLRTRIRDQRTLRGASPGSLEAFLATRGMRTLELRLQRATSNAQELAQRLRDHREVTRVRYPGLPSDPHHATASRTLDGFGAILSFEVRGGAVRADTLCQALELITHATSLGGVESTIERRAAWEGQEHLPPGLLRLSVGCEDVEDLWLDLERALARTRAV